MTNNLILAQAVSAFLVSWWKMLLMVPPFMAWAWLISTKLDKDAKYFHLNPRMWNMIHMFSGLAAFLAMLLIPIFWLSWPAGVAILAAPILVYWKVRDSQVPESQRFKFSGEGIGQKMAARRQARAVKAAVLQFTDSKKKQRPVPLKDEPLFPIHMLAEDVLAPALAGRASRVDVGIGPNGAAVSHTVDGIRYKREPIAAEPGMQLLDFMKEMSGLDVTDRRRRQVGQLKVKGPNGESTLSVITAGSSTGQTLRIEIDRAKRLSKPFDGLGLLAPQVEALRALEQRHERHGIVLIGAPSGHGLTTTSYSFVARHDAYTSNVKTLEREVQVTLEGVDQIQWDPSNPDVDYATNLQSILRRDPDIVLTAEILDIETARIAADPGMQGPLLYIPQPLPSITDQIRDWVKKVGDVKEATKAIRMVTNQRLMRSLCPNCRQAYQPTPEQIKKLNLPAKKVTQLFRAGGKVQVKNRIEDCPVCGGSGYLSQTAVFEVMVVDDEARKLLSAGDLKAALAHARRNKMIYLQEAALSKVINGETDLDEVVRVLSPSKPSTPGATPATESGATGPKA